MRRLKGFELEEVHDAAPRFYLEALSAAKVGAPKEGLRKDVMDKAVLVQIAYDELIAHFSACPLSGV
jgi:hypothetical protein